MRAIKLATIISTLFFFLLTVNIVLAAKIVDKDEKMNIVTLDESFKKGTRLDVFVGEKKLVCSNL